MIKFNTEQAKDNTVQITHCHAHTHQPQHQYLLNNCFLFFKVSVGVAFHEQVVQAGRFANRAQVENLVRALRTRAQEVFRPQRGTHVIPELMISSCVQGVQLRRH